MFGKAKHKPLFQTLYILSLYNLYVFFFFFFTDAEKFIGECAVKRVDFPWAVLIARKKFRVRERQSAICRRSSQTTSITVRCFSAHGRVEGRTDGLKSSHAIVVECVTMIVDRGCWMIQKRTDCNLHIRESEEGYMQTTQIAGWRRLFCESHVDLNFSPTFFSFLVL